MRFDSSVDRTRNWFRAGREPAGKKVYQQKTSMRLLSSLSKKSPFQSALRLTIKAVLGTVLLAVPLQAATIETVASLTEPLPGTDASPTPNPSFPYVRLPNGTFYGVSYGGFNGASDHGSVFRVEPNGSLATLHQFQPTSLTEDDANPTILISGSGFDTASPEANIVQLNGQTLAVVAVTEETARATLPADASFLRRRAQNAHRDGQEYHRVDRNGRIAETHVDRENAKTAEQRREGR